MREKTRQRLLNDGLHPSFIDLGHAWVYVPRMVSLVLSHIRGERCGWLPLEEAARYGLDRSTVKVDHNGQLVGKWNEIYWSDEMHSLDAERDEEVWAGRTGERHLAAMAGLVRAGLGL